MLSGNLDKQIVLMYVPQAISVPMGAMSNVFNVNVGGTNVPY